MSLSVLVVIVVAGIGLVVLAVHMSGGSNGASLADAGAARARFAQDFPDESMRSVYVTRDRRSAFIALEGGRVGVVQAVGGRFLTRILALGSIAGAPRSSDAALAIRFRDFTWPGGVFAFASSDDASAVEAMFAGLRGQGMGETV